MTVRQYLLLMGFSAVLCWMAWLFVLFSMEPAHGAVPAVFLFYATAFSAVAASFSVVGFWLRRRWRPEDPLPLQVTLSFRQSLFVGVLVVATLILQRQAALTWVRFFALVLAVTLIEFLVLVSTSHRRHRKRMLRSMERIR